jgi:flagellar motility protein MotE (MotC chaperone)
MRDLIVLLLAGAALGVSVWAALHFTAPKRHAINQTVNAEITDPNTADLWTRGVERIKEDRGEQPGSAAPLDVPPELRHYDERRWFLATQVAEVHKHNLQNCQDFVDLAAMVQRGDLVTVPFATEDYVLFGVGAKADDRPFNRYEDDHDVALYDEAQLNDAYQQLETQRAKLQKETADASAALKGRDRSRQREAQKEVAARQQDLKSLEEEKTQLDQSYGEPGSRQKLFAEYAALQSLAGSFAGRSYDLANPNDRQSLKINLLSSLRPPALKVMQEIAHDYHQQFDRPLPVSSLVRPEQYQHALRRVNRNATTIDTPPHSTGLAFDIDYRYMSTGEQNFLMSKLAQLKDAGRIEVIRERNANYHVFVFLDGVRPPDDLVTASLDEVGPAEKEANHTEEKPAASKRKSRKEAPKKTKTKSAAKAKRRR